jgi:hypothetical protein
VQDRPTAAELVDAVREFLERDVMPAVDGRVQFHTRVAVNALGMVSRELTLTPEHDAADSAELEAILGHGGDRRDLERELAARIRDGSLDEMRPEVLTHVRAAVARKLEAANPKYLD